MAKQYEYKVVIYRENILGSLFLGGSKVDPVRFSAGFALVAKSDFSEHKKMKDENYLD